MSWDAVESLDDARAATESLLLSLSWRTWVRLVVVTFFVGGIGGGGSAGQAAQGVFSSPRPPGATLGLDRVDPSSVPSLASVPNVAEQATAVLLAGVALVVVLVIGYAIAGAVMEFVLVESLRTRRAELRRLFRRFLVPGLRLFAFRTLVVSVLVAVAAVPLLFAVSPRPVPGGGVVLLPLLFVVGLVWLAGLLVLRLTTDFVVPTMIGEGRTVLSAWRRVLPLCRAAWREVVLYLVLRLVLGAAAAVVVGLAVGLGALVVAIPFAVVGGVVALTAGAQGVSLVVLVVLGVGFALLVALVSVVVQVPVVTYFRYYGLVLLGRFDPRLDLVQRSSAPSPPVP
jgi:hypothetical protein